MAKITTLTEEQKRILPIFHDEWLAAGRSTERADRPRTEAAIKAMYREINEAEPSFIWCDGPLSSVVAIGVLRKLAKDPKSLVSLESSLESSLGFSLGFSLESSLRSSLESSLRSSLWSSLESSLRSSLGFSLESSLWSSLESSLWSSLGSSLGFSLESSLRSSLWSSLGSSLRSSLGSSLRSSLWSSLYEPTYLWGQHESYWVAFYDFCERHLGVRYDATSSKRLAMWADVARSTGWWWPFKNLVVISERPTELHVDERGQIHNETGAAMRFADGYGLWAIHGVRVPSDVLDLPEKVTTELINKEPNAEVRRVMLERFGIERYIRESGAEKLNRDDWGTLWRIPAPTSDDDPLTVVEVLNSSPEPDGHFKTYFLYVNRELRPMRIVNGQTVYGSPQKLTAKNGIASTFGLRGEEYHPAFQS